MTVLILAGTLEARQLAQYCARNNIPAHASLSGATRNPRKLAVPTRVGGFGGADGVKSFVKGSNCLGIVCFCAIYQQLLR